MAPPGGERRERPEELPGKLHSCGRWKEHSGSRLLTDWPPSMSSLTGRRFTGSDGFEAGAARSQTPARAARAHTHARVCQALFFMVVRVLLAWQ